MIPQSPLPDKSPPGSLAAWPAWVRHLELSREPLDGRLVDHCQDSLFISIQNSTLPRTPPSLLVQLAPSPSSRFSPPSPWPVTLQGTERPQHWRQRRPHPCQSRNCGSNTATASGPTRRVGIMVSNHPGNLVACPSMPRNLYTDQIFPVVTSGVVGGIAGCVVSPRLPLLVTVSTL